MTTKTPSTTNMYYTPRAHNGYDYKLASDEAAALTFYDPVSLTVQSQAEDADLNVLMKRFGITGKLPENPRLPAYGDFTHITDYRSALDAIRRANEGFMELPADVRSKFDNDPQLLLEALENPANRDSLTSMGLLKQPVPPVAPGAPPETTAPLAPGVDGGGAKK